jgi:hypothetical protein
MTTPPNIYLVSKTIYTPIEQTFVDNLLAHNILITSLSPSISSTFCEDITKPYDERMNTKYLISSCNLTTNLCMYCTFSGILHSCMTFELDATSNTTTVDALCVDQMMSRKDSDMFYQNGITGVTLLNRLFAVLRDIQMLNVELDSMPTDKTLAFYQKHKFQPTMGIDGDPVTGLVPMNRLLTPPINTNIPPSLDMQLIYSVSRPTPYYPKWLIRLRRPVSRPKKYDEYTEIGYVDHPARASLIPASQYNDIYYYDPMLEVGPSKPKQTRSRNTRSRNIRSRNTRLDTKIQTHKRNQKQNPKKRFNSKFNSKITQNKRTTLPSEHI